MLLVWGKQFPKRLLALTLPKMINPAVLLTTTADKNLSWGL
jgi:hypothetical protein